MSCDPSSLRWPFVVKAWNPDLPACRERRGFTSTGTNVKDGEQCWFVNLADIRLFEVEDNHTRVYFQEVKPLINRSLNYLDERLDDKYFFRANRQQIFNLRWIEKIEPWFSGTLKVFLKGGEAVEISRRQTQKFKEVLSF